LEQFNKKIAKKILLVGAYTNNKFLPNIIKNCRLKPETVFSQTFNSKSGLETKWVDEFADKYLEIKNKKIKIQNQQHKFPNVSTDIFKNETINFIIEHSQSICIGLIPESTNFILLSRGTDNYFRCYINENDQLNIISPLTVGYKILEAFIKFKKQKHFIKLNTKSELKDLRHVEWFIVTVPVSKFFIPNIVAYSKLMEYFI